MEKTQRSEIVEPEMPPSRPKDFGYSEFLPRIWHGMTLRPWLATIMPNLHRVPLRRIPLTLSVFLTTPTVTLLALAERLIYGRKIAAVKNEEAPVFVLGYWRSGTTWLHEILDADERSISPSTFQCMVPDCFILAKPLAWILKRLLPETRPMDAVSLDMNAAQEDELAILIMGLKTPYNYMAFPSQGWPVTDISTYQPQEGRELSHWIARWTGFLKKVQMDDPSKRMILKSPPHTARIEMILSQFPNAKFVHISRDPRALFGSNLKLTKAMCTTQGFELSLPDDQNLTEQIIETHNWIYEQFFEVSDKSPNVTICQTRFEDMRKDPEAEIIRIYKELELGDPYMALKTIRKRISKTSDYKPDSYEIDPDLEARLQSEWSQYYERFGYRQEQESR